VKSKGILQVNYITLTSC